MAKEVKAVRSRAGMMIPEDCIDISGSATRELSHPKTNEVF